MSDVHRPTLSIVMCCYNSASRLPRTCAALRELVIPRGWHVEFVFVDNNSSDDTRGVMKQFASEVPNTSVLVEPVAGLMHARRRAVSVARGEWYMFVDDDNEPDADYIVQFERLRRTFPEAVIYTGNALLPAEYSVSDDWIPFLRWVAVRCEAGEFSFVLNATNSKFFPVGAGMLIRGKSMRDACLDWQTGASGIVGRQGSVPSGGEDVWISHHATRNREKVVFSDRLRLTHRIDLARLTLTYGISVGIQQGLEYRRIDQAVRAIKPWLRAKRYHGTVGVVRAGAELSVLAIKVLVQRRAIDLFRLATKAGVLIDLLAGQIRIRS